MLPRRSQRRSAPLSAVTLLRYATRREPQTVATAMPRRTNSSVATIEVTSRENMCGFAPGRLYNTKRESGTKFLVRRHKLAKTLMHQPFSPQKFATRACLPNAAARVYRVTTWIE
jgi:hypothetical protein